MNNWYEVRVRYDKTLENGMQKIVTETYLVDALSCTEAEARGIEEMQPFVSGELAIVSVKQKKYAELFFGDGDRFFTAKVVYISLNEKSGGEKRTSVQMVAQADDIEQALNVVKLGMQGTMSDYCIAGLNESPIMDVFKYNDKK
jgi:hypothetical protein